MSATGPITAEVRDVSTGGAQLYVLSSSFGLSSEPTLLEAALAVRDALASRFTVMLGHGQVGEVRRSAGIARLVMPSHAPGCIELGCEFDEPLQTREMAQLTSGLPDVDLGELDDVDVEEAPVEAQPAASPLTSASEPEPEPEPAGTPSQGRLKQPYRVYLSGCSADAPPPLVCRSTRVSKEGLQLRIAGSSMAVGDATEAAVAFMQQYGNRVQLKITEGSKHIWTGQAEVFGLEVKLARPDELLVSLGYTRTLRPAELERMGIATRVA
ncbi:MAG: hypothetical protein QNJ90_04285 [Planctomycetota bacterium]|nr:hypothetical protein [Planctomycetota bacterium]